MLVIKLIIALTIFATIFNFANLSTTTFAQTNGTDIDTSDTLQYNNPNLGFTLEYPSDWAKEESLTLTSPRTSMADQAPESISVTTEMLPTNLTLEEYSNSAINMLAGQFPNFTVIEEGNSTLSGFPAYEIIYTYTQGGGELTLMQIWTIVDGMAYALTYGGLSSEFESWLPTFLNMIDSFEITELL